MRTFHAFRIVGFSLSFGACGGAPEPVTPDPRIASIPLVGVHQGSPPAGVLADQPLAGLPAGVGPRMSDGERNDRAATPPAAPAAPPAPGGTSPEMTFFVTSTGTGDRGGDLGGLTGADAICQRLATAVGAGGHVWRAYLSTSKVHARDRIGAGPWKNAAGKTVSTSPKELARSGLLGAQVVDERGGRIDLANAHDVFTGSKPDGTFEGASCRDWTSSSTADKAMVGHADARDPTNKWDHWSSTHPTHGCDRQSLQNTAGRGHLYCFAAD